MPTDDHVLRGIVESDALAGLDGGDRHAQRHRVTVAGVDTGVRRLATADALHPVPHVGRCGIVGAGVGGRRRGGRFRDRHGRQQVGLPSHGLRVVLSQAAGVGDGVLVEIEHAAVGVVVLLHITRGIGHARAVDHLEALLRVIQRAVVVDPRKGVPVAAAVLPEIDTAVGHHAARPRIAREPVHRVDLVYQPLVRDARRVRPEEAELEVLARVEGLFRAVQQIPVPVGVLLAQLADEPGAPPAPRLVDVPGHLHGDDVAELAGLQVLVGLLVVLRAAPLRADLDHLARVRDGLQEGACILHGVGHGLLDIGIAPGADGFDAMLRMLEVGGRDEHGIDILACVEFVVVPTHDRRTLSELLERGTAGVPPKTPDVGDGDQFEIEIGGVFLKRGKETATTAIGEADDADADAVVGAEDTGVTAGGQRGGGGGHAGRVQELSSVWHRALVGNREAIRVVAMRSRDGVVCARGSRGPTRGRTTATAISLSLRPQKYYIRRIACKPSRKRSSHLV